MKNKNIRPLVFMVMVCLIFNLDCFELLPGVNAQDPPEPWPPVCPNAGHPGNTCSVQQHCIRTPEEADKACPDPKKIHNPTLDCYAPAALTKNSLEYQEIHKICPFLDRDAPLCCKAD